MTCSWFFAPFTLYFTTVLRKYKYPGVVKSHATLNFRRVYDRMLPRRVFLLEFPSLHAVCTFKRFLTSFLRKPWSEAQVHAALFPSSGNPPDYTCEVGKLFSFYYYPPLTAFTENWKFSTSRAFVRRNKIKQFWRVNVLQTNHKKNLKRKTAYQTVRDSLQTVHLLYTVRHESSLLLYVR